MVFPKIGGGKRVFCNPPYGRELPKWIKKAHDEAEKGALVVMLIPARTDTRAFHHEDGKWFIYGTCIYCGAKLRGISFTDSCAKELKDVMDREG